MHPELEKIRYALRDVSTTWIPQGSGWSDLWVNQDYLFAWQCFKFNSIFVLIAALWGFAILGILFRIFGSATGGHGIPQKKSWPVLLFLALAAGFSLVITEIFILSVFHGLEPQTVRNLAVITSLFAIAGIFITRADLSSRIDYRSIVHYSTAPTIIFVVLLLVYQYVSVFVPVWGDGTSYHLPYADFFLSHHGLAVQEHLIYPYHTFNFNLVYSLGLMIDRSTSWLQTLHALFITLSLFGIHVFCREAKQRVWVSFFAPFLFASIYHISHGREFSHVDAPGMWFVFACVFSFWLWEKNRETTFLVLSAAFLGMAMGTKYILVAFIFPAAACLWYFEKSWKRRFLYAGCVAAFGSWWYIRNIWLIGNPVHPFAASIFGFDLWDQIDMDSQVSGAGHAVSRSFPQFLLMPWEIYKDRVLVEQGAFLVVVMLYFSTAFFWLVRDKLNVLLVFCWLYLPSWIFGSQDARHLMPIFPLVFVHSAAVINSMIDLIMRTVNQLNDRYEKKFFQYAIKGGGILAGIFLWAVVCAYALNGMRKDFITIAYVHAAPGPTQEAIMLQHPRYIFFTVINDFFSLEETVFDFGSRDGRWFYRPHVVGNQYGPHGYYRVLNEIMKEDLTGISPLKLETLLRERYNAVGFLIPNPPNLPYSQDEFDHYFDLKFRNGDGAVYRIKSIKY